MELTVLVDNHTYIDEYFLGEPALSVYLEVDGKKIMLDTGYSDIYLKNAEKLGIDLKDLDTIVLSHGHDDHTKGLEYYPKTDRSVKLVAHPAAFHPKRREPLSIGCPFTEEELGERFTLETSREPLRLTEHLWFLGEIPRINDFENQKPVAEVFEDGAWKPDFMTEDSALVYEDTDGIYIITGCSHSGICNILEYAKKVTGKGKIKGLIGGFHLFEEDQEQIEKTADYLAREEISELYPSHCTCFHARCAINNKISVKEVGVSLKLHWGEK